MCFKVEIKEPAPLVDISRRQHDKLEKYFQGEFLLSTSEWSEKENE